MRYKKYNCPKCGRQSGVEIVYGYACGDLSEAAKRKEVYLGGCCIGVDDPNRHCLHCRHEWHELEVRRRGMIDCF